MSKKEILDEFNGFISNFKKKYKLNDYDLVDLILGKGIEDGYSIPIDIFIAELGCLESIVKYFRENKGLGFKEIAELVGRSAGVVINSYRKAVKKFTVCFVLKSEIFIPVEIFRDKRFSILENLVVYLKDKLGFRFREIGNLINRNEKTVWTVYSRAKKR